MPPITKYDIGHLNILLIEERVKFLKFSYLSISLLQSMMRKDPESVQIQHLKGLQDQYLEYLMDLEIHKRQVKE